MKKSSDEIARRCRMTIVDMLTAVNSSHLGCSFSIIDILVTLYHRIINVDSIKEQKPDRDYVILSKGHGAAALYATLASVNLISPDALKHYHRSFLAGHPMRDVTKGIEASTGSLGHGLAIGVGLALAAQHNKWQSHVYVLVGDGECQEGSVWEAVMMAARFKLDNITLIVDYNNLQGLDRTDDLMIGSWHEKFGSFGWDVLSTNGHDHDELVTVFKQPNKVGTPTAIIARTTKGKGISWIENKLEWHYKSFKPDQYEQAIKELVP